MKKLMCLLFIGALTLNLSGCFKRDSMEDITIYTTAYPLEYITYRLYGENSTIKSIYPNDTKISEYQLTDKQIKDYSSAGMYIFNGLSTEKDYVTSMFHYNKNLKIIDSSQSMEYTYGDAELWLDPSNYLMMSLNIKNGLLEYIDNHYLKTEIEENYEKLKVDISALDAKFNLLSESSDKKTIVVDNNTLNFLSKYGFTIISLDPTTVTEKNIAVVKKMISNKQLKYIYTLDQTKLSDTMNQLKSDTDVTITELHSLETLTEKERSEKEDYLSLMTDNIELLKNELYN